MRAKVRHTSARAVAAYVGVRVARLVLTYSSKNVSVLKGLEFSEAPMSRQPQIAIYARVSTVDQTTDA
jgi:predicted site-specific integrase-resolvase